MLSTTRQVELIGKKEFVVAIFDPRYKAFIVYIATLSTNWDNEVHPSKKPQISHLKAAEALTKVFGKYADFADVFSPKLAIELSEYIRIYNYIIELVDD